MFDSMHMHMPVVIMLFALLLVVLTALLFVGVRLVGAHIADDDATKPPDQPRDPH